jgi:hypothetical protein
MFQNVADSQLAGANLNRVDLASPTCTDPSTNNRLWVPEYFLGVVGESNTPNVGFRIPAPGEVVSGTYSPVRTADDVILTNVVGFDVKVWDPGAPIFSLTVGGQTKVVKPGDPEYDPDPSKRPNVFQDGTLIGYGAYVDLGWGAYGKGGIPASCYPPAPSSSLSANPPTVPVPNPRFSGGSWVWNGSQWVWSQRFGQERSWMSANPLAVANPGLGSWVALQARVYDTWSTHYETQGLPYYWWDVNSSAPPSGWLVWGDARAGRAMNGFDEQGDIFWENPTLGFPLNPPLPWSNNFPGTTPPSKDGVADGNDEQITSPPYPVPLRGIQVKIRVIEPDSRQIREVTIEQDFLTK